MVEVIADVSQGVKPKGKMFLFGKLLKTFIYAFAVLGVFFVILTFALINALNKDKVVASPMPAKAILTIDFENVYSETRSDDILMDFSGVKAISYYDLVYSINVAAKDDRVKVIVANISNVKLGLAQVQDLRNVIKEFRKTGKKAIVYSTGFGSFGGGTKSYYLASAFDEIWMQPNSELGITGISIEIPFFKDLLDKVGVEPEFYTRYEYKNAVSSLVGVKSTKEHRAELTKMVNSIFSQIVLDISVDRNIEVGELGKLIDEAPIFVKDKSMTKLVDFVDYHPNLVEKVYKDTNAKPITLEDYSVYAENKVIEDGKTVAFLVLDGAIEGGHSKSNPVSGEKVIGSTTVVEQLDDVLQNKDIKALVVRINSPGGSYVASNEIWYAIKKLKEKKQIPVIISMSDYAASGGYFIALSGDYVFAESSTITGSIGVLGGKMVLSGLWKKLGVNWEQIGVGKNSGALTFNRKFTASERAAFNKSLDNVYVDFTQKVSEARNIDIKKMDKIARGRVWTGVEAKENNLIDEIGGINEAVLKAKEMIGAEKVEVVYYPKKKTMQEKFAELMNGGVGRVETNKILNNFGIDVDDINLLKRFEYDAVLAPFKISM